MKNTLILFFLLLVACVSAQSNSFVTDRLRAAEYFRIGTNTSQKVTGFDRVITAPGTHDSLPTSRAVVDFLEANFTPIGYYTAGTGISISDDVITNSAPDQVVGLTGGGITVITGTYPNFTITSNEVDGSTTNELQNLSLSGQSLGISSGAGVTLPVVGVTAGAGIGVSSSSGNFTVSNTGDLSDTNELNTSFSVSGSNLALTDAGGTINVPVSSIAPVQAIAAGSGISISGTTTRTITAADVSDTNELQTLSIDGSDLTLSNGGGTVTLPGGADGNGIYSGSGAVPDGTVATIGSKLRLKFGDIPLLSDRFRIESDHSTLGNMLTFNINDGGVGFTANKSNAVSDFGADGSNMFFTATRSTMNFTTSKANSAINFNTPMATLVFSTNDNNVKFTDLRSPKKGIEYAAEYPDILTNDLSIPYIKLIKEMPKLLREVSDATAQNQEQYYSTTRSKVCYKTSGGTVIELH